MNQSKRKPPAAHRAAKAAPAVMVDPEAATAVQVVRAVKAAPAAPAEVPAVPAPGSPGASATRTAQDLSFWSAGVLLPLLRWKHEAISKRSTAIAAKAPVAAAFKNVEAGLQPGQHPQTDLETGAKRNAMQIILQEDIEKLGHRGDIVTVKPGYARNFLLPRKLAIEATSGNMNALERIRTSLAKKTATELEAAQKQAALINGVALRFTPKTGHSDQLFCSVTSADIAEALAAQGFKIDKRQVQLRESIKALGEYPVTIKIFRDVTAEVKAHVEKES